MIKTLSKSSSKIAINIFKGFYMDTPQNRKLGRVGLAYDNDAKTSINLSQKDKDYLEEKYQKTKDTVAEGVKALEERARKDLDDFYQYKRSSKQFELAQEKFGYTNVKNLESLYINLREEENLIKKSTTESKRKYHIENANRDRVELLKQIREFNNNLPGGVGPRAGEDLFRVVKEFVDLDKKTERENIFRAHHEKRHIPTKEIFSKIAPNIVYSEEQMEILKSKGNSIYEYMNGSGIVNNPLRNESKDWSSSRIKIREDLDYLVNLGINQDLTLYRGIKADFLSISNLWENVGIGSEFHDLGYASSSINPQEAYTFSSDGYGVILKINYKRGQKGFAVPLIANYGQIVNNFHEIELTRELQLASRISKLKTDYEIGVDKGRIDISFEEYQEQNWEDIDREITMKTFTNLNSTYNYFKEHEIILPRSQKMRVTAIDILTKVIEVDLID